MPADGIPRCLSTSNGDFGTSRLEEQLSEDYTIPRPFKRPILAGARRAQSANPMSESGEAASRKPNSSDVFFSLRSGHRPPD